MAIRGSVVSLRIQRGHVVLNYTRSGLVATAGTMELGQEGISVHVPRNLLAFGVHPEYIQSTSSLLDFDTQHQYRPCRPCIGRAGAYFTLRCIYNSPDSTYRVFSSDIRVIETEWIPLNCRIQSI
jgi:hypothetical protein